MIRRGAWVCASLVLMLAVSPTPAGAADGPAANTGTVVSGLTDVFAMAVGPDHIYLTPGELGSTIAVMNPDGSQAGTIENVSGASGAVVVHGILYVAAFGGGRIARFDLSTDPPTRLKGFLTGDLSEPYDLQFAGGHLWFTSGCDQWGARVAWMPLDGSSINELPAGQENWDYCAQLEGNRFAPNRIFLHASGISPQNLYEYAVGTATPHLVATDIWDWGAYNGQPVAPLPGGDEFVMSWENNGYGPSTFSMKDMSGPSTNYQGEAGDFAVTARNGGFLASVRGGSYAVGEVKVWRFGQLAPSVQFDFRDDHPDAYSPLAFSRDGTRLFAVTGSYDDVVVFRVLDPTLHPSSVHLQISDDTIKAGTTTDITVHLEGGTTNRDVTLMAFPWQTGWQEVGTQTADADGSAVFHVSPTRATDYVAEYAGDATTVDSGSPSRPVYVRAAVTGELQGAYMVKNDVPHFHDAEAVSYAMHIEPTDIQQYFHVSVEQRVSGFWTFVTGTDVAADGSGNGSADFGNSFGPGRYRVRATSYGGSFLVGNGRSTWSRFVIDP